jgi:hypothetical protein
MPRLRESLAFKVRKWLIRFHWWLEDPSENSPHYRQSKPIFFAPCILVSEEGRGSDM